MSAWRNKPCARCGKAKGPKTLDKKFCFRCGQIETKEAKERNHRSRVSKTYGIEPEDYDRLYVAQGGRCPICTVATGRSRRLSVDHDHALEGRESVRGLLCRSCNNLLGFARDDPEFFRRALEYLLTPPARAVLFGESNAELPSQSRAAAQALGAGPAGAGAFNPAPPARAGRRRSG